MTFLGLPCTWPFINYLCINIFIIRLELEYVRRVLIFINQHFAYSINFYIEQAPRFASDREKCLMTDNIIFIFN